MDAVEAVARAIQDVPPRLYFVRRLIDKSGYEVVLDTDPSGPIGDDTFKSVFTGTEADCIGEAARLIFLARAQAALAAARPFIAAECAKVAYDARDAWAEVWMKTGSDSVVMQAHIAGAETIATAIKETIR